MKDLFELIHGQMLLVIAPNAARTAMLEMAARLALTGPVMVIDGGNQFNAYEVARCIRRQSVHLEQVMGRIQLARSFTCYQTLVLLQEAVQQERASSRVAAPLLVFDLLSMFLDENVPVIERQRLLRESIHCLRTLSRSQDVAISVRPALREPGTQFLNQVRGASGRIWELEPYRPCSQPGLFEEV